VETTIYKKESKFNFQKSLNHFFPLFIVVFLVKNNLIINQMENNIFLNNNKSTFNKLIKLFDKSIST